MTFSAMVKMTKIAARNIHARTSFILDLGWRLWTRRRRTDVVGSPLRGRLLVQKALLIGLSVPAIAAKLRFALSPMRTRIPLFS